MEEILNFNDKVVIVTGASSGIGAATAKCFASFGATLSLVGRNEERLNNVAAECKTFRGKEPLCLLYDLTQTGSCESIVRRTVEKHGKIDVLVNCAGVASISSIFDDSMEIFDEIMNIMLRVPFLMSQLALPHLLKTKGSIVNISYSMTSRFRPGFMVCNMAKTALEQFTKYAAAELLGEGVRVNVVAAGVTRTNILSGLNIDNPTQKLFYETFSELLPGGKVLEPKEIAMYICFVASDIFPNLSGSRLVIDSCASLS